MTIYLSKGCGVGGRIMIDRVKSTCLNLVRFNYKSAAQSSDRSPCSNIPVNCSLCSAGSPAVWTYSIHSHYRTRHRLTSIAHFPTRVELSWSEKDGMKRVWGTCFKQCKSYVSKRKKHNALAVSEAHRARLLVRYVANSSLNHKLTLFYSIQ